MLVCVIDDDTEDVELFSEALKDVSPDIECIRFHKIPQALEHLKGNAKVPAVIFLDAHLPSGNSMELLSELRRLAWLNASRIFIYSGFVTDTEKNEYKKRGATDVITKPHHFHDLRSMLKTLIPAQGA
jgi:DNA-binding response OmpR family regulator